MGSEEGTTAKPAEISAEDFASSHPEAVEAWRGEGKEEGRKEGREEALANLRALSEALPDRPGAVLKAALEGKSPTEAKADLADELAAENVELKKKAELAAEAAGGDASSSSAPAPEGGSSDFMARAKALAEEKSISLKEAMSSLAKSEPELFKAYKDSLSAKK
jgi:hypothetical protein